MKGQGINEEGKMLDEGILIYNVLTKEDVKTIQDLVEAYISNKYKKITKEYLESEINDFCCVYVNFFLNKPTYPPAYA